eukprot:Rhum_TRINITY_DN14121_c21_g1::Rhum_TRINITY_DN14121_c21_g1_i1::g.71413::m.71413
MLRTTPLSLPEYRAVVVVVGGRTGCVRRERVACGGGNAVRSTGSVSGRGTGRRGRFLVVVVAEERLVYVPLDHLVRDVAHLRLDPLLLLGRLPLRILLMHLPPQALLPRRILLLRLRLLRRLLLLRSPPLPLRPRSLLLRLLARRRRLLLFALPLRSSSRLGRRLGRARGRLSVRLLRHLLDGRGLLQLLRLLLLLLRLVLLPVEELGGRQVVGVDVASGLGGALLLLRLCGAAHGRSGGGLVVVRLADVVEEALLVLRLERAFPRVVVDVQRQASVLSGAGAGAGTRRRPGKLQARSLLRPLLLRLRLQPALHLLLHAGAQAALRRRLGRLVVCGGGSRRVGTLVESTDAPVPARFRLAAQPLAEILVCLDVLRDGGVLRERVLPLALERILRLLDLQEVERHVQVVVQLLEPVAVRHRRREHKRLQRHAAVHLRRLSQRRLRHEGRDGGRAELVEQLLDVRLRDDDLARQVHLVAAHQHARRARDAQQLRLEVAQVRGPRRVDDDDHAVCPAVHVDRRRVRNRHLRHAAAARQAAAAAAA